MQRVRFPKPAPIIPIPGPEALTVERPVETRQEEIRALPGPHTEHEPDGDGTALITRDDVVRLHGALRNDEYVNGRPPVLQTGSWRFESSLVDVCPEVEVDDTPGCGPRGSRFESDLVHADVAQLEEASRPDRDQCEFESRRQYAPGRGAMASAPASEAGGWRFESFRPDQCEVVKPGSRLALNQEFCVRTVASQPSMPLERDRPVA